MKIWMYGWKFMPLHKGHLYCIDVASKECDKVYAIIFINWGDEIGILENYQWNKESLQPQKRFECLQKVCSLYDNVEPIIIDVKDCKHPDWTEDRDAETPLVRKFIPEMTYVYSSEESYWDYFKRAYPEAEHHIVDAKRKKYPISGTMIRAMDTLKEQEEWMVGI